MRAYRTASMLGVLVIAAAAITAVAPPTRAESRRAATSPVAPSVSLAKTTGPPTSRVRVRGAGFAPFERIDLFFDQTRVVFTGTGARGRFGPISITVPATALARKHWISAWGRRSGLFVRKVFHVFTNWSEFRYSNSRTASNPYENVLNPRKVSRLGLDWRFSTGQHVSCCPVPNNSSPAVASGMAYFGSEDGHVYGLNAATGKKLWSFTTGASTSAPAVVNGVVYISSGLNVYALNATTGAKVWSYFVNSYIDSSPAVIHGVVYVGSYGGSVYALSAATGAVLWSAAAGEGTDSSPAVVNGVVYVGSVDGNVYALDAATGAGLWTFTTTTGDPVESPAVANGVVYVGASDNVYALNATTGAGLWTFTTNATVDSSPAVAKGVVYIGSIDTNVYALDATAGAELWNYGTGSGVHSSPAVANGVVYVSSSNLYALNAATGAKLWSFAAGSPPDYSSPAVVNGVVYAFSDIAGGGLYAFHIPQRPVASSRPGLANLRPTDRPQLSR